jgi:hypothetical protein
LGAAIVQKIPAISKTIPLRFIFRVSFAKSLLTLVVTVHLNEGKRTSDRNSCMSLTPLVLSNTVFRTKKATKIHFPLRETDLRGLLLFYTPMP